MSMKVETASMICKLPWCAAEMLQESHAGFNTRDGAGENDTVGTKWITVTAPPECTQQGDCQGTVMQTTYEITAD